MSVLLIVFILSSVDIFVRCDLENPIVRTTLGDVRGYVTNTTRDNVTYSTFLAIPFGKPPVGKLRFQAPEPADAWAGVLDATTVGPSCHQMMPSLSADEDCLYLNIFTPVVNFSSITQLRAVMVFIYGGAFILGSSNPSGYAPDFFIDDGVVFVTLNYRIGPLGFLSLQNEDVPGNAGLKDQVLALEWIKRNIVSFGGDPDKITLFGESAGAASTNYMIYNKKTKGLFRNMILESGVSNTQWAFVEPDLAVKHAFMIGDNLNCGSNISKSELYQCLLNSSATVISMYGASVMTEEEKNRLGISAFGPTAEPENNNSFVTKSPLSLLQTGDFYSVPCVAGSNSREGLLMLPLLNIGDPSGNFTNKIGQNMTNFTPKDLVDDLTHAEEDSIRLHYFNGSELTIDNRLQLIDLLTDIHFTIEIQKFVNVLAAQNATIYNYYFSYDGPFNTFKVMMNMDNITGAAHSDELGYIMNQENLRPIYDKYNRTSTPHLVIDRMMRMWTNFAKFGNPTPDEDSTIGVIWKPFTSTSHNYLVVDENLQMKQGLSSDTMKFWNGLYQKLQGRRPLPE